MIHHDTINVSHQSASIPVRPCAVIRHSVAPGNQSQRQQDAGPSRQEENTHTQQHRQEGREQSAEGNTQYKHQTYCVAL